MANVSAGLATSARSHGLQPFTWKPTSALRVPTDSHLALW